MQKNFSRTTVMSVLKNILADVPSLHPETATWIFVKTLRVLKKDFERVSNVDPVQFENMVKFAIAVRSGKTLAEVFGEVEFFGNILKTAPNVFAPRLSTEALVNAVINQNAHKKNLKILDLCTGSGSVAVTLAKHLNAKVVAVDISREALTVAKENAARLGVQIALLQMDIKKDWKKLKNAKFDIIVSNPPYWNAEKIFNNADVVKGNPLLGFDGGQDGLVFHKRILEMAPKFLTTSGQLYLEIDEDQLPILYGMFEKDFATITTEKDYRGITRVLSGIKKMEHKKEEHIENTTEQTK